MSPVVQLLRLVHGYQVSRALEATVALGLPDAVDSDWVAVATLALRVHADPDALRRLVVVLAAVDVLQLAGDRVALTALGRCLRSSAPDPMADQVRMTAGEAEQRAWAGLADAVRTGQSAFVAAHGVDPWAMRSAAPDGAEAFHAAMGVHAARAARALLVRLDASGFGRVVDVGGGCGAFLTALLDRHPHLEVVCLDLPAVVARVDDPRIQPVGGSFFDEIPHGDTLVLCNVLHNWPDSEASAILARVAVAVADGGQVLVLETDPEWVGDAPGRHLAVALQDLQMLVLHGGRVRTAAQLSALAGPAGLARAESTMLPNGMTAHRFLPAPARMNE